MAVVSAPRRLKQGEHHKLKASLGYLARPSGGWGIGKTETQTVRQTIIKLRQWGGGEFDAGSAEGASIQRRQSSSGSTSVSCWMNRWGNQPFGKKTKH